MRIHYTNLLADATISATNQDANYPVANLHDTTLKTLWKASTNSSVITCTLAEASTVSTFAFGNHNIDTLSIKLTKSDTSTVTTNYTAADLRFSTSNTTKIVYETAVTSVEEIEYTITSSTVIYIGGLSAGQYLQMPYFAMSPTTGFTSSSSAQKSRGGVMFGVPGTSLETFSGTFNGVLVATYDLVNEFMKAVQKDVPHWVDRWETADDVPQIFAQCTSDIEWTKAPEGGWMFDGASLSWEECK